MIFRGYYSSGTGLFCWLQSLTLPVSSWRALGLGLGMCFGSVFFIILWSIFSRSRIFGSIQALYNNMNYDVRVKERSLGKCNLLVQWSLFMARSLGPWGLPCCIGFLNMSGWKSREVWRAGTSGVASLWEDFVMSDLVMTRFHCNSSRSKFWLFGTRYVICGTENGYGACFGLGTLDWGSHSSLWVPWGRGSLRELCSPVHYLSWWFSFYDMIFMKFSCHFFFFFFSSSSFVFHFTMTANYL